ncbi:MAG: UDP-N-acetylmuramoyl-tripeptide--D-alanyl-D-alanine ligase [Bacteroidia bacterium]|nr:UDP-N-acetylmuramoyl-tripeptide--D-alanyl-D-alanine ligase [Bacteroidia bacterium]
MEIKNLYKIYLEYPKICTDSRKAGQGMLFFGLKGENYNGNHFVTDALNKGVAFCIIDEPKSKINDRCILVNNSLNTLQNLAKEHRRQLNFPIIGITGSNGKTTTKELIFKVLSTKFNVIASSGNYNNHIGVPFTVLEMKFKHQIGIIEMGANHPGEIAALCKIARPDFGLITNIGMAHIQGFGSFEGVKMAKNELYQYIFRNNGKIFANIDSSILSELIGNKEVISYGTSKKAWCSGKCKNLNPYLEIQWKIHNNNINNKVYYIQTQLIGEYNFENILASVCIGRYFGVSPEAISRAVSEYIPQNNRSQLIKTSENTIILDAYNANATSMPAAINSFKKITAYNKILIIGDMLELGKISYDEHRNILKLIEETGFTNVLLVGPAFSKIAKISAYKCFKDTDELCKELAKNKIRNSYILIKASRGIGLEKAVPFL